VETCQGTENTIYLRTEGRKGQGQVKDGERERVRTSYPQGNGVVPRVEGSEKERERVEQRKALEIGLDRHTCSHTHTPKKKKKRRKKRGGLQIGTGTKAGLWLTLGLGEAQDVLQKEAVLRGQGWAIDTSWPCPSVPSGSALSRRSPDTQQYDSRR